MTLEQSIIASSPPSVYDAPPVAYGVLGRWIARMRAFSILLAVDSVFRAGRYPGIRKYLSQIPVSGVPRGNELSELVDSFNWAAAIYLRTVKCIQRSAALTVICRRRGIAARFVVGCRQLPFASHAWVDVEGRPVNESMERISSLRVIDTV